MQVAQLQSADLEEAAEEQAKADLNAEVTFHDDGVWRSFTRPLRADEAKPLGDILAGLRDASADGLPPEVEAQVWWTRAKRCLENGCAYVAVSQNVVMGNVHESNPWGVVLVDRDNMRPRQGDKPGRAVVVLLHVTDWPGRSAREPLVRRALEWCNAEYLELGEERTVVSMEPVQRRVWMRLSA